MKITEIKTAEATGHGFSTFVKILTDEGVTGVGECIHGGDGCSRLIENMAEMIKGENPLDVDRLWELIRRRYIFNGALAGNVVTAMTGIEIALWDLAGKALNVPVYQLLGGKFRDKIRLYCDCHAGRDELPESYAKRAKEIVAMGFDAIDSFARYARATREITRDTREIHVRYARAGGTGARGRGEGAALLARGRTHLR